MAKRECLIGIDLANALNQFLYKAHIHKAAYQKLKFRCPECKEPVSPNLKSKKGARKKAYFSHVKKNPNCRGAE